MSHPLIRIRCLRAWTAHDASYSPGEEYRVPEFIALILKRGGYVEILGAAEVIPVAEFQGELWTR